MWNRRRMAAPVAVKSSPKCFTDILFFFSPHGAPQCRKIVRECRRFTNRWIFLLSDKKFCISGFAAPGGDDTPGVVSPGPSPHVLPLSEITETAVEKTRSIRFDYRYVFDIGIVVYLRQHCRLPGGYFTFKIRTGESHEWCSRCFRTVYNDATMGLYIPKHLIKIKRQTFNLFGWISSQ